ncbi:MAG: cysteine desulfurase family protein [Myxococcota bacterium]
MAQDPIYLDHHATTPCDPRVADVMWPFFTSEFGNAGSRSHTWGLRARHAVEHARSQVATWLSVSPKEVVFTSGATESDNLAILGVLRAAAGPRHLVTLVTEHNAVLDPVAELAKEGVEVTVLPVGSDGLVDPDDVIAALKPHTKLVSIMRVNNETGVMQPLAEIGAACRERGVWLHTDAAQAAWVPVDTKALQVDLVSVSAHKIFGPKGIGALVVRRTRPRIEVAPLQFGGGQERGLRSGTLSVPLIVGLGKAAELVAADLAADVPSHIRTLRDRLRDGLEREVGGLTVNGSLEQRTPNNLHVSFEGVEAAPLMAQLSDSVGLSSGSACSSASLEPSHVLAAMGITAEVAQRSVRFGLGRPTTEQDIDAVIGRVAEAAARVRA